MAAIVVHAPSDPTVAGRVTFYDPSAHTPDYDAETNKLVNPDLSAVTGVPSTHWKVVSGSVVAMTVGEKLLVTLPIVFPVPVGDGVSVESVGGVPGLPVLDGSQLVNLRHAMSLVSGDRLKGDETSYSVEGGFQFPGTDFGNVDSINVTVSVESSATGTFRIYDLTNGVVIATLAFTNTSPIVLDMGTLSNLSTGIAHWELQLKTSVEDKDAKVHAGYVRFKS